MSALIRSELLKLRTLRSTAWAAAALLAIALLTAGLALGDAGSKDYSTPAELRETIVAIGYAAVFFLAVLGAGSMAGEYRHGTISQRFLANPARRRVLLAKLATYALVGFVVALVLAAVAAPLGEAVVSAKGLTLDLGDAGARMVASMAVASALAGMFGVVVGAMTRNPTTAMIVIFGLWIGEKIAGGWLGDLGQYLPFALFENTLGLINPMAWGYAAVALAGLIAALARVAQRTFVPRDVT
jgi:ABC-type transport system involved in multi-copper enzyme maturation permease subunit